MSDLAKHLPLSNREHDDESYVSSDRRATIAGLLVEAARLIGRAGVERRAALTDALLAESGLTREAAGDADHVSRLLQLAEAIRTGKRRGMRPLVHTARGLMELSAAVGERAAISDQTCGEIALWAATSGPFERRVVLAGHTIRASDAEWSFGRGPVLEGTARGIAEFALGTSDVPPQPIHPPR